MAGLPQSRQTRRGAASHGGGQASLGFGAVKATHFTRPQMQGVTWASARRTRGSG
jgi:hypothetical protein